MCTWREKLRDWVSRIFSVHRLVWVGRSVVGPSSISLPLSSAPHYFSIEIAWNRRETLGNVEYLYEWASKYGVVTLFSRWLSSVMFSHFVVAYRFVAIKHTWLGCGIFKVDKWWIISCMKNNLNGLAWGNVFHVLNILRYSSV